MKTIGFVDYYLSEWHANHYPKWMAKLSDEFKVAYGWAEIDVSPVDGKTTDDWCETFGAQKCATLDELCEKSDYIVILAPSDPQVHLKYAEAVFPYGKPTYVDKTFAPDAETAQKIFDLAAKYHTPFFSTSALRFATELETVPAAKHVTLTGGGSNLPEYVIHLAEQAVLLLQSPVKNVKKSADGEKQIFTLTAENGRIVDLIYAPELPFTAAWDGEKVELKSDFFGVLMEKILAFFADGKQPFDAAQTMEVMRVRDGVLRA